MFYVENANQPLRQIFYLIFFVILLIKSISQHLISAVPEELQV